MADPSFSSSLWKSWQNSLKGSLKHEIPSPLPGMVHGTGQEGQFTTPRKLQIANRILKNMESKI
jgi:hypothetical protein